MSARTLERVFLFAVILYATATTVGFYAARPHPPDLKNLQNWTLIKSYRGLLDPLEGEIHASVYVYKRLSNGKDPITVLQNRVEVSKLGSKTAVFMWNDDAEFAGGMCEIIDVDGDQRKEILLSQTARDLRVVSYNRGSFRFRPRMDELVSLGFDAGPADLDEDGMKEFTKGIRFPEDIDEGPWIYVPQIKRWSDARGFYDVSREFGAYYRQVVIPDLEKRAALESKPEMSKLYTKALDFIRRNVLGE
jgi:hypothetical protein